MAAAGVGRAPTWRTSIVALLGPFDNRTSRRPAAGPVDANVLGYLQRRFQEIQALGDEGYRVSGINEGNDPDARRLLPLFVTTIV
jgi:hypothetical protein